jgi:hypothetical protein
MIGMPKLTIVAIFRSLLMNDPLPLSELGGWDEPNPH